MPESELHATLVKNVVSHLKKVYPEISVICDVQKVPGNEIPPLIGNYRPDVWARLESRHSILIAEAKTPGYLHRNHSLRQMKSFLNYLRTYSRSVFVLSVLESSTDVAKITLKMLKQELCVCEVELCVFDGLDLWKLDNVEGKSWHLL